MKVVHTRPAVVFEIEEHGEGFYDEFWEMMDLAEKSSSSVRFESEPSLSESGYETVVIFENDIVSEYIAAKPTLNGLEPYAKDAVSEDLKVQEISLNFEDEDEARQVLGEMIYILKGRFPSIKFEHQVH